MWMLSHFYSVCLVRKALHQTQTQVHSTPHTVCFCHLPCWKKNRREKPKNRHLERSDLSDRDIAETTKLSINLVHKPTLSFSAVAVSWME